MAKLVHKEQSYTGGGDTSDLIKWSEASKSVKKNLLPITLAGVKANNTTGTWNNNVYTLNSIALTFIADERGYITQISVNGTAGANTYVKLCNAISLERTQYRLSGNSFPTSSCALYAENHSTGATSTPWANYNNVDSVLDVTSDNYTSAFWLNVTSGTALSNQIIKPMLRLASIADDTYEPYIPDNTEVMRYTDNAVLGAKNLLPNKATSQTINGVTFTVNSDGSVTANGTNSSASQFALEFAINQSFESGRYILSGCPSGGGYSSYWIYSKNATDLINTGDDVGNGVTLQIDGSKKYTFAFFIAGSATVNITFKPMLRLATDTDDTYVPYAMTNRELTEELTVQTASITTPIQTQEWNLHYVKKYGKVVEAVVTMKLGENVSAWGTIAQIPVGFRPSANQYPQVVGIKGDYTSFINLQIAPSGDVQTAGALTSGTIIRFDATYIIN